MRARVRAAGAALAVAAVLAARGAAAHPMAVARADVVVGERSVDVSLGVNLFELDLLLSLDADRNGVVDPAEVAAARGRIADYLRARVSVESAGAALPAEVRGLRPARSADGRDVLQADLRFSSSTPLADLVVRCEPLADLGPGHRTLARISRGGAVEDFVFEGGAAYRASMARGGGAFAQFLRLGILHIFTGYDHVLFLLGLLLVGGSLADVLKIVTSFTAAHSLTLSLAVLGALSVPPRLVECAIAASIAYVALENLARRRVGRRWLVSLGFGLVHGLGFASVLADLRLPRAALASSLVAFNAGVEMGQVAIVLAALPLLGLLRRSAAYRPVVASASALILVVGLFWLVQRAL